MENKTSLFAMIFTVVLFIILAVCVIHDIVNPTEVAVPAAFIFPCGEL